MISTSNAATLPTPAATKDRGGDCLDVICITSPPTSIQNSGSEIEVLSCNDWTVTFKREGRVIRGTRKVIKGVTKVAGAVRRRMSMSTLAQPGDSLSKGEAARVSGVLKETFDDDSEEESSGRESGEESRRGSTQSDRGSTQSDRGSTQSDRGSTVGELNNGSTGETRRKKKTSVTGAMSAMKSAIKSMASGVTGRKKSGPKAGNDGDSEREEPPSATSTPVPNYKQNFIGQDNFTVHVYVNNTYVSELEMRLPDGNRTSFGIFATFNHSNSTKPAVPILQHLYKTGVMSDGENVLKYVNSYRTNKDMLKERSCSGTMHVWSSSTLLIVSDIDGTVTKSDVVGLIDSSGMVSESYSHTHPGICKFYSDLVNDLDIRFVYLTSRPISLMQYTRKYLRGLQQGEDRLPNGCVLCHPGSIKDVLVTELVKKNPNEFKTDCLRRNIVLPFAAAGKSHDEKLFVAGFGNKQTDATAYVDVGISMDDIYIIDKSSRMMCERERAELEVQAFHAVSGDAGMRNNYRRKSILQRLPSDIAEGLRAGTVGADGAASDGDGDKESIEEIDKSRTYRRRSFSAGALSEMGMAQLELAEADKKKASMMSSPTQVSMKRGSGGGAGSEEEGGGVGRSTTDEFNRMKEMKIAAMDSYSDGRLEAKIQKVCDKERGTRNKLEAAKAKKRASLTKRKEEEEEGEKKKEERKAGEAQSSLNEVPN